MNKNIFIIILLSVVSLSAQDSLRNSWNKLTSAFSKKQEIPQIPLPKQKELESIYLQAQVKEQSKDYTQAAALYQKVVNYPYLYPVLQNDAQKRLGEMRKKQLI